MLLLRIRTSYLTILLVYGQMVTSSNANDGVGIDRRSVSSDLDILERADNALANNENEANFRSFFAVVDEGGQGQPGSPGILGFPGPGIQSLDGASVCGYDEHESPCSSEYREPSGRCTTTAPGRKTWGMAKTPFIRKLDPRYGEVSDSRRQLEHHSGNPLVNPRLISTTVTTTDVVLNEGGVNAHVMQWGQFIAHEFTQLAEEGNNVACCAEQMAKEVYGSGATSSQIRAMAEAVERQRGDICMPIVAIDDPVYGHDICMNHVRSKDAVQHGCVEDQRQQMNAITHVFDASAVYGSSENQLNKLRDGTSRRLKIQTVAGRKLPPQTDCDRSKIANNRCPFMAGDGRVNITPNLVAAHTTFLLIHNKIADELKRINNGWTEDKIFQETRKIVSAIQSNIHYYEWLPVVVGSRTLDRYRLRAYDGHDPNVNPSVLNELATAAMRFGHSLIDGFITLVKDNGRTTSTNLTAKFFDSDEIYNDGVNQCIKGLYEDKPWKVDRHFPAPMRDQLVKQKRDIVALNINRGRDHGLESYVNYRRAYGLSVPSTWNELRRTHPTSVVNQLRQVYTDVADVELYIGGVTENAVDGGLVGELFSNILADGFQRLRKGDRFWFESSTSGLTSAQISAIRSYGYAQLMCEAHSMPTIVNKGFSRDGHNGARSVSCTSFDPLNLDLWSETTGPACSWRVTNQGPCAYTGWRLISRTCSGQGYCFGQCTGFPALWERCENTNWSWNVQT